MVEERQRDRGRELQHEDRDRRRIGKHEVREPADAHVATQHGPREHAGVGQRASHDEQLERGDADGDRGEACHPLDEAHAAISLDTM